MTDELAAYDYPLSEELIARHPAQRRDDARLLLIDRAAGRIEHRTIRELPALLRPGDRIVLNDSRVVPARLLGHRAATGGRWEGLFLQALEPGVWRLLAQTRGKLRPGEPIELYRARRPESPERLPLELVERDETGIWTARVPGGEDFLPLLERFGTVPLPPYIGRTQAEADDVERYQTTYARHWGSVAAPTAGLHFTPELFERLAERGIAREFVTLHVGIGTFRPIAAERLSDHAMHAEWCELSPDVAGRLEQARDGGGRIVAVGTTSARTLETAARSGKLAPWSGATSLFIRPPFRFHAVDALLTNFHLPRSTLLVLVCAFAGRELTLSTYEEAIRERYRFYSYGDAMLIV